MRKIGFICIILISILISTSVFPLFSQAPCELSLNKSEYTGLGDSMKIHLSAPDYNKQLRGCDTVLVHVSTTYNSKGIDVVLSETGISTGEFTTTLRFSATKTDATSNVIKVSGKTDISVMFAGQTVSAVWMPCDGRISFGSSTYEGMGATPTVTVYDNDLNLSPNVKDEVMVSVNSTSDNTGIKVKLVETTFNSGNFTGTFTLTDKASDAAIQKLHVQYGDELSAYYLDKETTLNVSKQLECSATWKPESASLTISSSEFVGLDSVGTITVRDNDINTAHDSMDSLFVQLRSDCDPKGISVRLYETGNDTGTFSGKFGFSSYASNQSNNLIKVLPRSEISAEYVEPVDNNNQKYRSIKQTASFRFEEASLQLSSDSLKGYGNALTITIDDSDADLGGNKDSVQVKVTSNSYPDGIILWLNETGEKTGVFTGYLYFSDQKPKDTDKKDKTLVLTQEDLITVMYKDNTLPDGGSKEITKSASWSYDDGAISFDKSSYAGYNTPAVITVNDADANKSSGRTEYVNVRLSTPSVSNVIVRLKETSSNSGSFTATIYFGRKTDSSHNILKVVNGDTVSAAYDDQGKSNIGRVEANAVWAAFDAELSFDKQEYTGNDAAVKITLKDPDVDTDRNSKDRASITLKIDDGPTRSVVLTETGSNTGIFTSTIYINSSDRKKIPSIALNNAAKLSILYIDKDTPSGTSVERTAAASWKQ